MAIIGMQDDIFEGICSLVKEKTMKYCSRKTNLHTVVMRMLGLERREKISEPWMKN
jgi:hypothetical protein